MGESKRRSKKFRPALNDRLEDRTVPSHFGLGQLSHQVASLGFPGGFFGGGFGGRGGNLGGITQTGRGTASSSVLRQDAQLVQQAFQTINSSFLSAVATLRQTATSTSGPTQDGLTAYNATIASAISTLNSSISSALSNLTNTSAALVATIEGYTATLQTELQSAGTGLSGNANSAVFSLEREGFYYIRNAENQSTSAILTTKATGSITSATLQTYNQAVNSADQAFNLSISNAKQTAISAGAALNSSAVQSAVSTLQTALTSAINGLGTQFTSSSNNPTSAVTTQLSTFQQQLLAITVPKAGSHTSARIFSRAVSSIVSTNLNKINQTVATAVQSYNNSLL
jgi:hypothetical protein